MLGFLNKKQGFTLIEFERSRNVRRNESFTLIELLVIVAIIGLLISVIVVSTDPQREKAKDAKRQTDIREIMNVMGMCYSDDDQYPNITVDASSIVTNTSIASSVKTYLSPFPEDPTGENYYGKANAANRQQYCIYAFLGAVSPTTYFCASEKGVLFSTTPPSLGACCY